MWLQGKSESGPWDEDHRKSVLSRAEGLCMGFHPSVNKYLLSTYYVPDAVLEPATTVQNRTNSPCPHAAQVPAGAEATWVCSEPRQCWDCGPGVIRPGPHFNSAIC